MTLLRSMNLKVSFGRLPLICVVRLMLQDIKSIFSLCFFKRISDVYDEQFEGFVCEGGVEYAGMQVEDLPIRIPDGAHWRDVREVTENVGNKLVEAFIAIEQNQSC